ncbi:M24 family metallopeptidase [Nonomuraea sp. NPDC049269]|uniref:M24 family metallopeptidase n=1 Tax=Nonomuraea sp. NPDC049269 TaxID=3364349 RepID=UPI00371E8B71
MDLPTYSPAERDRRWDLARELMDAEGVDALVVHGGAEWAPDVFFTNDRPGAIVVFPRADEPIALVRSPAQLGEHLDARRRGDAVWIRPENVLVAKHAHGVAEVLRAHGLGRSAIGVLGLEPCPPFHADPLVPYTLWSSVLQRLPQVTLAARASYEAGLAVLRPGHTFGEVVTAMKGPFQEAGGWHAYPLVHAVNPCGAAGGSGAGFGALPRSARYGLLAEQPTIGSDLPLRPGMTFAFAPNCVHGRRLVRIGGTVVVGEDAPIELNTITTHLIRSTR